ncbi:MAG: autotransporter outer membrane beta-barrel domain-containing protein, partial [Holophagales bacterium]|nr:autotransporter outer membrane beta-barrel domain-containing protein [Holophagales bacterium]
RDDFYVDGVLSYGRNSYDTERVIVLPAQLAGQQRFVAVGDPDSDQIAAHVSVGYDLLLGDALTLGGFVRGSWVRADIEAYAETGSFFFDLAFDSQEVESLLGEVGVEVTYPWSVSWGVLQPLLRVAYLHEFEDGLPAIRGRFLRDPSQRIFRLEGQAIDADFFNLAAGITATLPGGWATYFQYDTDLQRDDLDIYTLSGGFRFQF